VWFALAGAVLVTVAVYLIGSRGRGGGSPLRLTLAGVGIGAVISGIVSTITLVDPQAFDSARSWNAGSVSGRPMTVVLGVLPFIAVGVVLAIITARDLNAIGLGDDLARSLGTRLVRTRMLVVVAVTLLAGAATAGAGPITFVGLMIPPVAKALIGADQRWILAMTCVLSPVLVLVSDIVGRVVTSPAELPVGIVLSFVGAPALVVLARRLKAGRT
jgi:iron complex transport system permease protein